MSAHQSPVGCPLTLDDADTGSARRALQTTAVIVPAGRFDFAVTFTDSGTTHKARFYTETGRRFGWCDCKGFEYRGSRRPCAHLWAVQQASQSGAVELTDLDNALNLEPCCPRCGNYPDDHSEVTEA